jgi:endonuclease/exonuclease/phosphatase family metal-dependent hydrolase
MAGFRVGGQVDFNLLAIWPVQHEGGLKYAQTLQMSLERYSDLLSERAIMAGDLNSSSKVSGQQTTHPRFVSAAAALGLASAYHHLTGEDHGAETVSTYRHDASRSFHIDYCFLSRSLLDAANFGIANGGEWRTLSDHSPIVLDVPDSLLVSR